MGIVYLHSRCGRRKSRSRAKIKDCHGRSRGSMYSHHCEYRQGLTPRRELASDQRKTHATLLKVYADSRTKDSNNTLKTSRLVWQKRINATSLCTRPVSSNCPHFGVLILPKVHVVLKTTRNSRRHSNNHTWFAHSQNDACRVLLLACNIRAWEIYIYIVAGLIF